MGDDFSSPSKEEDSLDPFSREPVDLLEEELEPGVVEEEEVLSLHTATADEMDGQPKEDEEDFIKDFLTTQYEDR